MVVPQNLPGLCQGIKSRTKLLESLWVKIASAFSTNGFSLITKKITSLWCVLKQHTHNEMYEEKKFVASMYHSIFELKIWKKTFATTNQPTLLGKVIYYIQVVVVSKMK